MYHSGDTCIYEGMYTKLRKWNKFDVMFIPINGRDAKNMVKTAWEILHIKKQ